MFESSSCKIMQNVIFYGEHFKIWVDYDSVTVLDCIFSCVIIHMVADIYSAAGLVRML
jgi:hypothetical protein